MIRTLKRERSPALDLDAIRRDHPLASVVGAVVPLKKAGRELTACCPFHSEKTASFTIYDGGRRFQCFGCGAGGDVLDFVQQAHGVGLREAADMLTGGDLPMVAAPPVSGDNRDNRDDSEAIGRAQAIWDAARPASGTLAETYLRSRGLYLPIPGSIRFAWLPYRGRGPDHPALVAAVHDVAGVLTGVQRTFLNAAGTGKAAVPRAKLSLGRVSGSAIRLAPPAASLVVCEGLEDGLTLTQDLGRAVWVSAGTCTLPSMQFPDAVGTVAIGGDNDAPGRAAAMKAAEAFCLRGLTVRTFFPADPHKDFNEQLQKGARP